MRLQTLKTLAKLSKNALLQKQIELSNCKNKQEMISRRIQNMVKKRVSVERDLHCGDGKAVSQKKIPIPLAQIQEIKGAFLPLYLQNTQKGLVNLTKEEKRWMHRCQTLKTSLNSLYKKKKEYDSLYKSVFQEKINKSKKQKRKKDMFF